MFHVGNRGVDRQDLFSSAEDRACFERSVAGALGDGDVELHAYCWMTNHVHLLVRARGADLPASMRQLQSTYAQRYNRRTRRSGPLFEPRFWSTPVRTDAQLLQCARYIHRNPIAAVGVSGLVDYPHSSFAVYVGARSAPPWLTTGLLASMVTEEAHRRDVVTPRSSDRLPVDDRPPLRRTSVDELRRAVDAVVARHGEPSGSSARTLLMTMLVELRAGDAVALGRHLGVQPVAVRAGARRGRVLMATDARFARLRSLVLDALG